MVELLKLIISKTKGIVYARTWDTQGRAGQNGYIRRVPSC